MTQRIFHPSLPISRISLQAHITCMAQYDNTLSSLSGAFNMLSMHPWLPALLQVLRSYLKLFFTPELVGLEGGKVRTLLGSKIVVPSSAHKQDYVQVFWGGGQGG